MLVGKTISPKKVRWESSEISMNYGNEATEDILCRSKKCENKKVLEPEKSLLPRTGFVYLKSFLQGCLRNVSVMKRWASVNVFMAFLSLWWFKWEWSPEAHIFECLVTKDWNCLQGLHRLHCVALEESCHWEWNYSFKSLCQTQSETHPAPLSAD